MNKAFKFIKKTLKYGLYVGLVVLVPGMGYLQFINSVLGPIDISKQNAFTFYKQTHKMSTNQATRTYYWVLYNISLSRILNYRAYCQYCEKFNSKVIQFSLQNYQKQNVIEQIGKTQSVAINRKDNQLLFSKIIGIRKENSNNIEIREYLIKEIRKFQKEMNIFRLVGIDEKTKEKVDIIHKYLCKTGCDLRDGEILMYTKKLPQIESQYPNDYLHKILVI